MWVAWVLDVVVGLAAGLAGVVVLRRRRWDPVGLLLLGAGATWFVGSSAEAGVAELRPVGVSLQFVHRAVLISAGVVALLAIAHPYGSRARRSVWLVGAAVVVFAYGISLVRPVARSVGPTLTVGLVFCALVVLQARHERDRGRDLSWWWVLAGFVLWVGAATVLRSFAGRGTEWRLAVYDMGFAIAAIALARTRLSTSLLADTWSHRGDTSVVSSERALALALHDPGLRLGFSTGGGFVTADSTPLSLGEDQRSTVVDVGSAGEVMIAHRRGLLDDRRLRTEVSGVVRLLAEQNSVRQRIVGQAAAVSASRDRLARSEERAATELAAEVDRRVARRVLELRSQVEALATPIPEALGLVDDILQNLAEVTGDVPSDSPTLNLENALTDLAQRCPIAVDLRVAEVDVDPATARAFVFVASESIANAAKHSRSDRLRIDVTDDGSRVSLAVSDSGAGGAMRRAGGGLAGLDRRMAEVGGTLAVNSTTGEGTVVRAYGPPRPRR